MGGSCAISRSMLALPDRMDSLLARSVVCRTVRLFTTNPQFIFGGYRLSSLSQSHCGAFAFFSLGSDQGQTSEPGTSLQSGLAVELENLSDHRLSSSCSPQCLSRWDAGNSPGLVLGAALLVLIITFGTEEICQWSPPGGIALHPLPRQATGHHNVSALCALSALEKTLAL